jgi:hypothetical protein
VLFVLQSQSGIVNAILQRHKSLEKLFNHGWAHLVVLDWRTGEFFRYQPTGDWCLA